MKTFFQMLVLFISFSAFSQDPYLQKPDPEATKEAKKLTDRYNLELALTGEQQLLFQQKVAEFLIRREKVEENLNGKEKLDFLFQLQEQETAEMADILTRPQLQVYKQVRTDIQPLEVVNKEIVKKKDK